MAHTGNGEREVGASRRMNRAAFGRPVPLTHWSKAVVSPREAQAVIRPVEGEVRTRASRSRLLGAFRLHMARCAPLHERKEDSRELRPRSSRTGSPTGNAWRRNARRYPREAPILPAAFPTA